MVSFHRFTSFTREYYLFQIAFFAVSVPLTGHPEKKQKFGVFYSNVFGFCCKKKVPINDSQTSEA